MARQARIESETGYYHIMTRGINKEKIFDKDKEKEKIVKIIKEKTLEEPCRIIAYCIMDNHIHLVIVAEKHVLINVMKKINITYAMFYNQRHKRIGPVFQDRFKSENITNESYLYGVIRYIHNNPVKAGMVSKAQEYIWSSMKEYLGHKTLLIDKTKKEEIMKAFISETDFINFHKLEDEINYLEVKEEAERRKEKRAEEIIERYCAEKGIIDRVQLKNYDEIILKLLEETGLSYRKIAAITGVSLNMVYNANKKNRP